MRFVKLAFRSSLVMLDAIDFEMYSKIASISAFFLFLFMCVIAFNIDVSRTSTEGSFIPAILSVSSVCTVLLLSITVT